MVRRTLLIATAVVAFTWACGSSSGTSVAPTFVPSANQVALKITLAVTNTQWNTGIVDDFSIVVSGGHADFTLAGSEGVQQVYVDRGVPFTVRVTGPEGYTETK